MSISICVLFSVASFFLGMIVIVIGSHLEHDRRTKNDELDSYYDARLGIAKEVMKTGKVIKGKMFSDGSYTIDEEV